MIKHAAPDFSGLCLILYRLFIYPFFFLSPSSSPPLGRSSTNGFEARGTLAAARGTAAGRVAVLEAAARLLDDGHLLGRQAQGIHALLQLRVLQVAQITVRNVKMGRKVAQRLLRPVAARSACMHIIAVHVYAAGRGRRRRQRRQRQRLVVWVGRRRQHRHAAPVTEGKRRRRRKKKKGKEEEEEEG